MAKERIIEELGESGLLLPERVNRALAANDRVKYLLTLLQTARAAADGAAAPDLREERLASRVDDPSLDRVVGAAAPAGGRSYLIPRAEELARRALAEVATMLAPLDAAGSDTADGLARRLDEIGRAVHLDGERITAGDLDRLTSADTAGGPSLHVLVMDAHRQLNALIARLATETIDGARAHELADEDRPLVRAFMRGLHETEHLRFDHPGLETIAARSGDALVLQNDLGTTDAHVVVMRIAGRAVTITYTDVHLERLVFFQGLLAGWDVRWEDTRSRSDARMDDGLFHLAVGRWESDDDAELERFLTFLGSRLVFMIDWNRARKRLRGLVGRRAALELLRWCAQERLGHMAFLRAGGERLVYDALEFAGRPALRTSGSLSEAIGAEDALAYLQSVLRICSDGLVAERPLSLIRDEVRAELVGYLRSAREELLDLIARHGELIVEIAEATRDALDHALSESGGEACRTAARHARAWEHDADDVVNEVRTAFERSDAPDGLLAIVEAADDAADGLEEAAFYVTLAPLAGADAELAGRVQSMVALVLASARAHFRALSRAADVQRGGPREDLDTFLEAIHEVVGLERESDDAQRAVHAAIVAHCHDAGEVFVVSELTRALEEGADALMHSALLLRDQVLGRAVRAGSTTARRPAERPRGVPLSDDVYLLGSAGGPLPGPEHIGAKAHGLDRAIHAGLTVPEAVAVTTEAARRLRAGERDLHDVVAGAIGALESVTGRRLGGDRRPLLVSVRSGAPVSMPGMLETVLDVGLTTAGVRALSAATGNPRLAWDSYRRLIESFAHVVRGCPPEPFEQAVRRRLAAAGLARPTELEARALEGLVLAHLERFRELTGEPFPQDPVTQVEESVLAVLRSWEAPKAREYRRMRGISEDIDTAVIVQRMVFGNAGGRSGSGVAFSRDPALGQPGLYVDVVRDGQGEDVVAGRTELPGGGGASLGPELREQLRRAARLLEAEFSAAQELEFTIEDGELYILQTRDAKTTPWAALRIAVDQVDEGLITPARALERVATLDLGAIRRTRVQADAGPSLAQAVPASLGVATGPIALDSAAAARLSAAGTAPILVRPGTATDDVGAMAVAAGVLTGAGGRTSHAAVVARELGRPCLVGCRELAIDLRLRTARIGSRALAEGDEITIDAESGRVFAGSVGVLEERPTEQLEAVASWRA